MCVLLPRPNAPIHCTCLLHICTLSSVNSDIMWPERCLFCRALPVTTSVNSMPKTEIVSASFNGKPIDTSTLTNFGAYNMPPQPVLPIATSGKGTMATASLKGVNSITDSNGLQFEDM